MDLGRYISIASNTCASASPRNFDFRGREEEKQTERKRKKKEGKKDVENLTRRREKTGWRKQVHLTRIWVGPIYDPRPITDQTTCSGPSHLGPIAQPTTKAHDPFCNSRTQDQTQPADLRPKSPRPSQSSLQPSLRSEAQRTTCTKQPASQLEPILDPPLDPKRRTTWLVLMLPRFTQRCEHPFGSAWLGGAEVAPTAIRLGFQFLT